MSYNAEKGAIKKNAEIHEKMKPRITEVRDAVKAILEARKTV